MPADAWIDDKKDVQMNWSISLTVEATVVQKLSTGGPELSSRSAGATARGYRTSFNCWKLISKRRCSIDPGRPLGASPCHEEYPVLG